MLRFANGWCCDRCCDDLLTVGAVTGVATARSSQLKQMDAVQFTSSAMLIQRPHHSSAQTATVSKSQIVSNDPSDPDWRDRLESEETEWHTRPWLVRKVASTEAGVARAGEGVDKDSEYSSHAMLVKDKHHTVDPGQIAEDAEVRSWTERNHSAVMAARRQMPQASHSASRDPICQHLLYTHTQPSAHRTTSPPRKQGVPTAGSKSPPNKQASTPHPNSVALRPPTPSEPPSSPAMFMTHENMEKREARMEEERRAGLHMEQASASASTGQQGNVLHVGHGEEGERGQEEEERAETPESLMATSSSNSPVDNLPSAIEKEKGLPPKP